ncbi:MULTISPECIES: hypothetical protein [Moorena]|nr:MULTISPECIES: hypothetical protein [Moorena]NEP36371.1 hypothetical protein [Moorena sp. SIO3B2]NEQ10297.1 hypothetical protein [Moorena sp. SIO4E2]NES44906.1 hypothetical protein [Moorena sp. SIO2C4]NET69363.1 hypothetical protein [Moorena sp. SIO1G6]
MNTIYRKLIVNKHNSDAEVRPVANLITGQTHHYGLGEPVRSWGFPP